jgi:hypothetical protein
MPNVLILLALGSQCIVLYFRLHALLFKLQLLGLQINAEKYYFGIRKSLVEFDEVLEVYIISQSLFICTVALFPDCYTKFQLSNLFSYDSFTGHHMIPFILMFFDSFKL